MFGQGPESKVPEVLRGLCSLIFVAGGAGFLAAGLTWRNQKTLQAHATSDTESRSPAEPKCYLASQFEDARDHEEPH